jgi:hypothetical protein
MRPELPYLAAGGIALVTGVKREGKFPADGMNAAIATTVLVTVASATANTKMAPLVHAIGLLVLMAAIFGAARIFNFKPKVAK